MQVLKHLYTYYILEKKPQTTKPALCSQNRSLVDTVNNNLTFQEV